MEKKICKQTTSLANAFNEFKGVNVKFGHIDDVRNIAVISFTVDDNEALKKILMALPQIEYSFCLTSNESIRVYIKTDVSLGFSEGMNDIHYHFSIITKSKEMTIKALEEFANIINSDGLIIPLDLEKLLT